MYFPQFGKGGKHKGHLHYSNWLRNKMVISMFESYFWKSGSTSYIPLHVFYLFKRWKIQNLSILSAMMRNQYDRVTFIIRTTCICIFISECHTIKFTIIPCFYDPRLFATVVYLSFSSQFYPQTNLKICCWYFIV